MERRALRGGYVLEPEPNADGDPELVVIGTGSETQLAAAAARALCAEGRRVRAVSLPSLEVFAEQDADYRASVLPDDVPRLVVEAGVEQGVASLLRPGDRFHGLARYGASAPWAHLAEHFGFTADEVTALARQMLT